MAPWHGLSFDAPSHVYNMEADLPFGADPDEFFDRAHPKHEPNAKVSPPSWFVFN